MNENTKPKSVEELLKDFDYFLVEMHPINGNDSQQRPPLYDLDSEKVEDVRAFFEKAMRSSGAYAINLYKERNEMEIKAAEESSIILKDLQNKYQEIINKASGIVGSLGGLAAAKAMTPEQRSERAKKAVKAREEKRKSKNT